MLFARRLNILVYAMHACLVFGATSGSEMKYQIDQSGKIEDTNKLTIVAFANGKTRTLKISGVEKQKLIRSIRVLDYPKKTFIYKIFSGLIFLLLNDQKVEEVIIDREYPGHEATVKVILTQLFTKFGKKKPEIEFTEITKKSLAHKIALETFRGKRKPDLVVKAEEVLRLFYQE